MTGRLVAVAALAIALAASAQAQTYGDLAISVEARTIHADGGERGNTAFSTGAIELGKTEEGVFSKMPNMCGFAVAGDVRPGGNGGWRVSIIPVRVEERAVTFQAHWARLEGERVSSFGGDLEVTLRPGESMPLDLVPLSPDMTMPYLRCGVRATSLYVAVRSWPRLEQDDRLLSTELWLVEQKADGSERSQALSLRSRPSEETTFYFDTVTDAGVDFDLYGDIIVTPRAGHADEIVVTIDARSRITEDGRASTSIPVVGTPERRRFRARSVESTIGLRTGEVIDVELPRLTENASGAFAGSRFSLRIRSRQIR